MDLAAISHQVHSAVTELLEAARLEAGQILVVGCSTSEVSGAKIGTAGNTDVAAAILRPLRTVLAEKGIYLAVQCCEHLNRALVVEREAQRAYCLEEVTVIPVPKAGGALAAQAMHAFTAPVVVETVRAHAGLDIGNTLIGMHLKPVVVPVRLSIRQIGAAPLVAARTRPKLIGGARAVYER